ncbi:helix-turn-helix domain-containing protein [Leifsonia sp. NPDC058194]|uniref:helix-turn-helix domain-containing protein n=1 Tax=Leifsonia sp. NPDC058194 TaxID=3346374 RepID=UPI0036DDD3CA
MEKGTHNLALAAEIRAERAAKGLTQKQLADISGINYETLKHVLKGDRDINVTQIAALADAFDIPARDLVDRAMARAERMSAGSTTSSTNEEKKDPREMDADELDKLRQSDVALAAHPKTEESEQDEQFQ